MTRTGPEATFTHVSLRAAFRFVLRGLPLAVLLGVLGILLVWSNIQQREASWTAVAHLLSTRPEFTPTVVPGVIPGTLDPALYRAAVSDGPVLAQLRTSWSGPGELPDEHTLLSNLRVLTDNQLRSSVVRVEYRSHAPALAAAVANGVAQALVDWDRERSLRPLQDWRERLNGELAGLEAELAALPADNEGRQQLLIQRDQRLRDLAQLQATLPIPQLSLLAVADQPAEPDGQGLVAATAVALVVGVLLAYLGLLAADSWRGRPARQQALPLEAQRS